VNRFRLFALAALLAAGCSKPLEFADASPLAELLPEDLKAEEGVPHPAAVLFGEFQDSLLFHTDSFDWYEDNYSTGELVDSEDFAYTWRGGGPLERFAFRGLDGFWWKRSGSSSPAPSMATQTP
jgi:hypothetical protein